jgi:hypothetical protein
MRQWRVGSFSMGLVLVLLGIGLLMDRFQSAQSALELIINWWPLVLILLGIEVLAAGVLSRGEKFTIKYDFWSVLLVIFFFLFSLTGYALSASGIIPMIQEAVNLKEHSTTLPEEVIGLEGIERVVLSCSGGALVLRSTDGSDVRVFGRGTVSAVSGEEAAELAESAKTDHYIEGSTLYIQVNDLPYRNTPFGWGGARDISRTILVPGTMALEVQRSRGYHQHTDVILDNLAAPWSLNVDGQVKATLSPSLHVKVFGLTGHPGNFTGNASWGVESEASQKAAATITLGEGTWPLHIQAEWDIEANIR